MNTGCIGEKRWWQGQQRKEYIVRWDSSKCLRRKFEKIPEKLKWHSLANYPSSLITAICAAICKCRLTGLMVRIQLKKWRVPHRPRG